MGDKLYLLTETELRNALMRAMEVDTYNARGERLAYDIVATLTPLSPDWSKAPEDASQGQCVLRVLWADRKLHLMPDYKDDIRILTGWIPRPEVK